MHATTHRLLTRIGGCAAALLTLTFSAQAGLVVHWPLDTNGNDASGNNRNLSLFIGAVTTNEPGQFIIGSGALGGAGPLGALAELPPVFVFSTTNPDAIRGLVQDGGIRTAIIPRPGDENESFSARNPTAEETVTVRYDIIEGNQ